MVSGILILYLYFPPNWFLAQNSQESVQQESALITEIEKPKPTRPYQKVSINKNRLKEFLKDLSIKYGVNYDILNNIVICESGWDINAYNEKGKSYGVSQFILPTWEWFNKIRGIDKDYLNPFDQLEMMAWAFSKGYASHWDCFSGKR